MAKQYPISASTRRDLKSVEAHLERIASDAGGVLGEVCSSTLHAGGKRLRPALVLVSGQAGTYELDRLMPHAVAVELIHTASLVHDDILDEAPQRRGKPSVHARWGLTIGLASGDYLFSKAFEIVASSGLREAPSILAATAFDLTAGELMQRRGARRVDVPRGEYLERIGAKTASLFATSCRLGALASGTDDASTEALAAYGENLGLAFQVFDDVLDVAGETKLLGKTVGADLRDGTLTLPMMLAVEELGRADWLAAAFEQPSDEKSIAAALDAIASTRASAVAKETARGYVSQALEAVGSLTSRPLRKVLSDIGNYVIERYD